ncbi:MAG TPA: hypothetical protein VI248_28745 [Kineosporiaceae bacterium]
MGDHLKRAGVLFTSIFGVVVGAVQVAQPDRGVGWLLTALAVTASGLAAAVYLRWHSAAHRRVANAGIAIGLVGATVCVAGLFGLRVTRSTSADPSPRPTPTTRRSGLTDRATTGSSGTSGRPLEVWAGTTYIALVGRPALVSDRTAADFQVEFGALSPLHGAQAGTAAGGSCTAADWSSASRGFDVQDRPDFCVRSRTGDVYDVRIEPSTDTAQRPYPFRVTVVPQP